MRKGELDHIVDDVSDGEGDEEAGNRARAEQQRKDDEMQTRQIAQVVAGGYKSRHGEKGRGKFSSRDLIEDDEKEEKQQNQQEEEIPEEGPEMLEWLNNKMRSRKAGTSYEEEDYSDGGSEFEEQQEEGIWI